MKGRRKAEGKGTERRRTKHRTSREEKKTVKEAPSDEGHWEGVGRG